MITTILFWLAMFILFWVVSSIILFGMTFALFAAVFKFKEQRDDGRLAQRHWSARAFMYAILYIGLASDMLLNFWTLTVLYLEWPREILSTSRVKRWAKLSGYRKRLSWFFAMEYLLPVDPRHMDD